MTFAVDKSWAAVFAQRQMGRSSSSLGRPFRRLVSGAQVQEETEGDPEYDLLAKVNVRIRELNQALRNANDGISLTQLAGDGLREMESALKQIRNMLTTSGAKADKRLDMSGLQEKIRELIVEVDRITQETQMVDANLLNAGLREGGFKINGESAMFAAVPIEDKGANDAVPGVSSHAGIGVETEKMLGRAASAATNVAHIREDLGNVLNKFEFAVLSMNTMSENLAAACVRTDDLVLGNQVGRQVRNTVMQETGVSLRAQANHPAHTVLTLLS